LTSEDIVTEDAEETAEVAF